MEYINPIQDIIKNQEKPTTINFITCNPTDDEYSRWIGDDMLYFDEFDAKGNRIIQIPINSDDFNHAAEAKKFIKTIQSTKGELLSIKSIEKYPANILNKRALLRFQHIQCFFSASNTDYEISEYEKLIETILARYPVQPWMFKSSPLLIHPPFIKPIGEIYNSLIEEIRIEANSTKFKKKVADRIYKATIKVRSAEKLISHLFFYHTRLLTLRLDFHILNHYLIGLTPESIKNLLAKFLIGIRGRKNLYDGFKAYVIQMEFGRHRKYHFHCFFFYNGAIRQDPFYLSDQLGDYWKEVTDGMGYFFNCHKHPNPFKSCGIGRIEHDDIAKRGELSKAIKYICKKDEYLRVLANGRTFFKSATKKINLFKTKKLGRPRIIKDEKFKALQENNQRALLTNP